MKLIMPLRIELWKKKKRKYSISLNIYRNLHYQVNNNLKKVYKKIVKNQLSLLQNEKLEAPIWLSFTYYHPTKRKSDLENFCAIQNKYLQDALVELWTIEEDNYDYIQEIKYRYGGYRKNDWKVDIKNYEIKTVEDILSEIRKWPCQREIEIVAWKEKVKDVYVSMKHIEKIIKKRLAI